MDLNRIMRNSIMKIELIRVLSVKDYTLACIG